MAIRKNSGGKKSPSKQPSPAATGAAPKTALRLYEPRFRLAFEDAPIGMAVVGLDFKIKRANKALCESIGFSEDDLIGRLYNELTHPDDVAPDNELVEQLFRGDLQSYRHEKRFITKDGHLAWFDLTAVVIRDDNSDPLYGLAMVQDITDRKRTIEALRTSEERYRSFVVNCSEGIWRCEFEESIDVSMPLEEQVRALYKLGYVAECNDAMARMYGYGRANELVGKRLGDLVHYSMPTNVEAVRALIRNNYRLIDINTLEEDIHGNKLHVCSSVIGIVVNGYLLRVWGTQRDQTEKTLADIELIRSQKQLRSLAAKIQSIREKERTEMAREMHDVLGQMLTGIKIDLSWLAKRIPEPADEQGREEIMQRLDDATRLLNETIGSVKLLSAALRPGVLDKLGLVPAVEWQCQEFQTRTDVDCTCRFPEKEIDPSSDCSTAIFRILQECLTNVVRHSNATAVSIELDCYNGDVCLTVRDNGRGITETEISAPGSLGLLSMRERAEVLDGRFNAQPDPDGGTIISVCIPLDARLEEASL